MKLRENSGGLPCGFAALLAESLRLSVELSQLHQRLRRGGKASHVIFTHGKPEAFRKERGKAAKISRSTCQFANQQLKL